MKRVILSAILMLTVLQAQTMIVHLSDGQDQQFNVSDIDSVTFEGPNGRIEWIGHASFKIKTHDGLVIYIDPYADGDYSEPADLVFITHGHADHNQRELLTLKENTKFVVGPSAAQGEDMVLNAGDSLDIAGIRIWAVEAYNDNHPKGTGVGFVIDINGVRLYHSGDTDKIDEMTGLANMHIKYAFLCCDGAYNMGPAEAMEVAEVIQAEKVIPMHLGFNPTQIQNNLNAFNPPNKLIMEEGDVLYF
jgi:L-ascorbate metabolism protein UlaG (beta-lactamase superfamily)